VCPSPPRSRNPESGQTTRSCRTSRGDSSGRYPAPGGIAGPSPLEPVPSYSPRSGRTPARRGPSPQARSSVRRAIRHSETVGAGTEDCTRDNKGRSRRRPWTRAGYDCSTPQAVTSAWRLLRNPANDEAIDKRARDRKRRIGLVGSGGSLAVNAIVADPRIRLVVSP